MKRSLDASQTENRVMFHLLDLLSGEPTRSMEAAKRLISLPYGAVDPALLVKVAGDERYHTWSRIAAVYSLGLLRTSEAVEHQRVLRTILSQSSEGARLRGHAAEALGNLRDEGSTDILKGCLMDDSESLSVRKWCLYALSEIGSSESREALLSFADTGPRGVLAEEMESMMQDWAIAS